MKTKLFAAIIVLALSMSIPQISLAGKSYLTKFNAKYGTTGTALNTCTVCHKTASGPTLNPYGTAVGKKLRAGLAIATALTKVQPLDSDKDTFTNIREIKARTFPGKATSKPAAVVAANASSPEAVASGTVQTSATVVNTYAQNDYANITFDQIDPNNYRYVHVKSDMITIGQTAGFTGEDGGEAGELEATFPLNTWSTMQVMVYDTGTVKVFLDGSPQEFISFDF
jgi:hypothetical protein